MHKINHFYHIYAGGHWKECLTEHIKAMKDYELINNIENFYVGMSGQESERELVKQYLKDNEINFILVDEKEDGWEQITMNKLRDFAQTSNGLIFYAHTKGAFNHTQINVEWRKSMCYYNVVKWRDAVSYFNDDVETVGCHWCHNAFWGGTYWWATTEYLKKLDYPLQDSRWRAEEWIGSGSPKIFDMNPGWPGFERFVTSW